MMKIISIILILIIQNLTGFAQLISLKTDNLNLTIAENGQFLSVINPTTGKNYLTFALPNT